MNDQPFHTEANAVAIDNMTASVAILPCGVKDGQLHVELYIDGDSYGQFPTYTEACEALIRRVNAIC
ncbi:hypothetical protein [Photobacterium sp. OFAV2-7]|uniref:hypothetical protein n=1 Tax=Photobacterium sp. OFAV2-7 TaxID=2917748 RepID=UPI001EF53898|nr:hypothetical protein [Photobacterium sp. OFAV2-7]MCG7584589.1 hypothetical protein [Photobacterium sp. OFAV2-7]